MSKTMILAVGGAGCNMAETIMRVANAHWVKEATYLFADSDMERLSELGKKGFETLSLQCDSDSFPTDKLKGVEKLYILAGLGGVVVNLLRMRRRLPNQMVLKMSPLS
ncbi:MAG: hypothetical protein K2M72_09010 [Paramuribaculum sp.]|nr:hypothetical protein [Paramuribaculum sp.]